VSPPGQKEAPLLVAAKRGAKNEGPGLEGVFAFTAPQRGQYVNFPLTRGTSPGGNVAHGIRSGAGRGVGGACAGGPPPSPLSAPWYRCHTGSALEALNSNLHSISEKRKGLHDIRIFPLGFQLSRKGDPVLDPLADLPVGRGTITTFTAKAARRLKRAFMELEVPGATLWSFSLTTHGVLSPEEWRAAMKRFRCAMVKRGWAGIWRVELQRRKAPHAHVALWLPLKADFNDVRLLWLRCTRELDDEMARQHAVQGRPIPDRDSGWGVYMGCHSGKKKEEQLGWVGKQWGVWNASIFAARRPETATLSRPETVSFCRVIRKLEASKRRNHCRGLSRRLARARIECPLAAASIERELKRMCRRLWVPEVHSCALRLMNGETAARIVSWAQGRGLGRSEPQIKPWRLAVDLPAAVAVDALPF
jgi:hypothetical protein